MTILALLLATTAQVTTVADAADDRHGVEVDLSVTYLHSRRETRITREQLGGSFADELHHLQTLDETLFRLNVGLYHDLELHVFAPYVVRDQQDYRLYDPATSSLVTNRIDVSGCGRVGACTTIAPIVVAPGQSRRQGFRDPTVGIAWAPVNPDRDLRLARDVFPGGAPLATWVLGVDYTFPLPGQAPDDPSRWGAAASPPGAAGTASNSEARKAHLLTGWTAFSKRVAVLEPYLRLSATVPLNAKQGYDNCSHPELLADVAVANCAGSWHGQTGYKPAIEGAAMLGSELVVREFADGRLAFDLHGDVRYHGPARDYTQVTDALGKLTSEDEYATLGGTVGFYAKTSWIRAGIAGSLGYDTAHYLTHEDIGAEKDATPGIQISGGSGNPAPDQNPNFDFRLDQPGFRLRAEANLVWSVSAQLALIF